MVLTADDDAAAIEASLAENVERLPMDEMDQYEAFARLRGKAWTRPTSPSISGCPNRSSNGAWRSPSSIPTSAASIAPARSMPQTLQLLTLATKERQKAWLALAQRSRAGAATTLAAQGVAAWRRRDRHQRRAVRRGAVRGRHRRRPVRRGALLRRRGRVLALAERRHRRDPRQAAGVRLVAGACAGARHALRYVGLRERHQGRWRRASISWSKATVMSPSARACGRAREARGQSGGDASEPERGDEQLSAPR